jgi:predicted enzyme related to lactoylglutathione lyase
VSCACSNVLYLRGMITGTHVLIYSSNPESDRAFFRDVLKWRSVDAGEGWLIFALPPAEAGFHPAQAPTDGQQPNNEEHATTELYFMCDNLRSTLSELGKHKVSWTPIAEAGWGTTTTIRLPSGTSVGLYEPRHPMAI